MDGQDALAWTPRTFAAGTPPAPRVLSLAIVLMLCTAAVWALRAEVDVVAVAPGRLIPAGRVKAVQSLDAGVVGAIHVHEGEHVDAGTVLLELDATEDRASAAQVAGEIAALRLELARLALLLELAAVDGAPEAVSFPRIDALASVDGATAGARTLAAERARREWNTHRAEAQALADDVRRRRMERDAARARLRTLEGTFPLVTERAGAMAVLAERGLVPRAQWLDVEMQRREQAGRRDEAREAIAMLEAAVAAGERQRAALHHRFVQALLAAEAQATRRLEDLEQEAVKLARRLTQRRLVAPVSGTVQRLAVQTLGGIVSPAEVLVEIVPDSDALEVETWIGNRDSGFVHPGQAAIVKLETFPFTRHGTLTGTLRQVAADAVDDPRRGLVYPARVALGAREMVVQGRRVALRPGMAATVEVRLGRRRIAEFLLAPLRRYREEAWRER
jgi:hemolysin D